MSELWRLAVVVSVLLLWSAAFYIIKTNEDSTLKSAPELRALVQVGAALLFSIMLAVTINFLGPVPPTDGLKFLSVVVAGMASFLGYVIFKRKH